MAEASEEELPELYKEEIEAIQKSSKKSPTTGKLLAITTLFYHTFKSVITELDVCFVGKKKKKSPAKTGLDTTPLQNSFYSGLTPNTMNSTPVNLNSKLVCCND